MTDGKFPTNIEPKYIPYSKDHASLTACANPIPLDLKSLFPNNTVVVTAVPGAFTPTCTETFERFQRQGRQKNHCFICQ